MSAYEQNNESGSDPVSKDSYTVSPGSGSPSATDSAGGGAIELDLDDLSEPFESDDAQLPSTPYIFDPSHVTGAAKVLDRAFADLLTGWDGWRAVDQAVQEIDPAIDRVCVRVLSHIAARPLSLEHGGRAGAELKADRSVLFPAITEVDNEEVKLWNALIEEVSAPAAIARLRDLLFVRRSGNVGEHARSAAHSYLDAIRGRESGLHTTTYLLRAWTAYRLVKATDMESDVLAELQQRIGTLVDGDGLKHPGTLFPLLRAWCEKPQDPSRTQAARTHAQCVLSSIASRETRGYLASEIAKMRRGLLGASATDDERVAVDADEVAAHVRGADHSTHPSVEMMHLEQAAKTATRRGLQIEAREIAARMQAIKREHLGMVSVRTPITLPVWFSESFLEQFTQDPDWRPGVSLFMEIEEPPSGSVAQHRLFADGNRETLRRALQTVILGSDGLPRSTLVKEEDEDRHDIALASRISAETQGHLLVGALMRISDKYGVPDVDELAALIVDRGASDTRLARSLAKGFHYFWTGDYEAAVSIVIPKIEAAARDLLRELDEGIYRVQVKKDPGGYPGMYVLFSELEKLALDEDWAWFLRWLLLGPIGLNIRNEVAHGFVSDLRPEYVVLVLRAAAVLITAAPESDQRRVDLLPAMTPTTGVARIADIALSALGGIGALLHTAAFSQRLRLRRN
ncbi:DUF4209 domain-containing protein [Rhodococcus koreensis]